MKIFETFLSNLKLVGYCVSITGTAFSISLCGLGLAIYTTGLLFEIVFFKKNPLLEFPHKNVFFLLIISLLISVFISSYPVESWRGFRKYVQGFLFLYAGIDILKNPKKVTFVLWFWGAVFFLSCSNAFVQMITGTDLFYHKSPIIAEFPRLRGSYNHSNDFCSFLLMGVGIFLSPAFFSLLEKKKMPLFLNFFLLIFILFIIFKTFSRGGIISVFFIFTCFFILCGSNKLRLILIFFGLGFFLLFIPREMFARFQVIFDFTKDSNAERLVLAKIALRMISENPFFGLGLNTYARHFLEFRPAGYLGNMSTHNTYLQMTAEFGLVGFFLYASFLIGIVRDIFMKIIKSSYRDRVWILGVFVGIIGFLINSLFDSTLQSTQLRTTFWLFLGLGISMACKPPVPPKQS